MRYNRIRSIPSRSTPWSPSRRDILRYGAAALAATAIAPPWMRRAAAQSVTFDYYISTTGSDSNPGTLSSPWALTSLVSSSPHQSTMAGKRVGLIAGTYNVMTLLGISSYPGNQVMPSLLVVPGGTSGSPTYLASCDTNGNYSARAAIINGQGTATSNSYGQTLLGSYGSHGGYITIDGFEITGVYYHAVAAGYVTGGYNFIGTRVAGITIQNNYIHGVTNTIPAENPTGITLYATTGAIIQNNYITNITDTNNRATGIEQWNSDHAKIQYNTLIGSSSQCGGIFIKNLGNTNNTVSNNFIDLTSAGTGSAGSGGICCDDDAPDGLYSTSTDAFYNNIVIADNPVFWYAIEMPNAPNNVHQELWYNNTFVGIPGSGQAFWVRFAATNSFTFYNNILDTTSSGFRGVVSSNNGSSGGAGSFALCDYNLYRTINNVMAAYASGGVPPTPTLYTTLSGWQGVLPIACVGKEAHSRIATPTFVGGSPTLPAQYYQLASGSAGKNAGSTNGQTSGSATDMGAWGNGATQIGASFAPGVSIAVPVPTAPVLSVS